MASAQRPSGVADQSISRTSRPISPPIGNAERPMFEVSCCKPTSTPLA